MMCAMRINDTELIGTFSEDTEEIMKLDALMTLKAIQYSSVTVDDGEHVDRDSVGRENSVSSSDALKADQIGITEQPRKKVKFMPMKSVNRKISAFMKSVDKKRRTIIESAVKRNARLGSGATYWMAEKCVSIESHSREGTEYQERGQSETKSVNEEDLCNVLYLNKARGAPLEAHKAIGRERLDEPNDILGSGKTCGSADEEYYDCIDYFL